MSASKRLALLCALPLLLLLAEGALSLATGRSLRELWPRRREAPGPAADVAAARAAAARETAGPLRVPEDPLVSYTLKVDEGLDYTERAVHMHLASDDLGLRTRPGPPPAAQATRIVVLGDSVAFGFGLKDEETLAAQLERVLAAALPGRAFTCFTVAMPSWNFANAWRFLLDHVERFDPDIVLYMPVENDLEDAYGVNEAGERRVLEDPAARRPLLHVHPEWGYLSVAMKRLRAAGQTLDEERLGPEVLNAALGTTSRERYAALVRVLAHGQERLARRGAHLALAAHEQTDFQRELRAALARAGTPLAEIPLLESVVKDDTLGVDPHPSAETVGVFALWIAGELLARGWVDARGAQPLPSVPERYAGRRARLPGAAEARAWSETHRAELLAALVPRISTESLEGLLQVLGGLNLDASTQIELAAVLPAGKDLRVRLAPIEGRPDLYPLDVDVFVNERALGALHVAGTGESAQSFALSAAEQREPFEVRLVARDWAVITVRGHSGVAAVKLVELASLGE